MKKTLLLIAGICLVLAAESAAQREPLANAGKRGLYAKSLDQVLRLRPEEIDLATAALIVSENWSDLVSGYSCREKLDEMAYEIRDIVESHRQRMGIAALPIINQYLFQKEGFRAVPEANDPNDLFLHRVLERKRGYCLSLSILYLSITERLGLPVYGVVVPGHFFVRYDDGGTRVNIETTGAGATASDEHYIEKFKVPTDMPDSVYLKNLDNTQTLGCLFNNLGNCYSAIGDVESAQSTLECAVQINLLLAESRVNLGNIYLQKGFVGDAIHQYQMALRINHNDSKVHLNLGNAYSEQGRFNDAISEYTWALSLDSDCVDAHKNMAIAYCEQDMHGQAVTQLQHAISLEPKDAGLYARLGDVYRLMDDCGQAMLQYEKALRLKRNLAEAHLGLGMCYRKIGRLDQEIQAYKKALAIQPDMLAALVNLGNAYVEKEDYDQALKFYEKAVRIKPDDPMIYYNFGSAYANKGDYERAVTVFQKAIAILPNLGDAHKGLAFAYYHLQKYDLALMHIKTAEKLGVEVDRMFIISLEKKL